MGIKTVSAVPEILMQNDLATFIEPHVCNAESIAYYFLADWRESRLHGPNQVYIVHVMKRLVDFHGDFGAGVTKTAKMVDHCLFIPRNHQCVAEMQIRSVKSRRRGTGRWIAKIRQEVDKTVDGLRFNPRVTRKVAERLAILSWILALFITRARHSGTSRHYEGEEKAESWEAERIYHRERLETRS